MRRGEPLVGVLDLRDAPIHEQARQAEAKGTIVAEDVDATRRCPLERPERPVNEGRVVLEGDAVGRVSFAITCPPKAPERHNEVLAHRIAIQLGTTRAVGRDRPGGELIDLHIGCSTSDRRRDGNGAREGHEEDEILDAAGQARTRNDMVASEASFRG